MELKKVRFNFDKLLEPYSEGGTEQSPVTRTIGTITSKLIIAHRIPPDIVGLALFKVFWKIAEGLEFKGNGKYGSKGAELFSCIKAQCVDLTQDKCSNEVIKKVFELGFCTEKDCRFRCQTLEKQDWKYQIKRYFGMRSGWFTVLITIAPIIGLLCLCGMA